MKTSAKAPTSIGEQHSLAILWIVMEGLYAKARFDNRTFVREGISMHYKERERLLSNTTRLTASKVVLSSPSVVSVVSFGRSIHN